MRSDEGVRFVLDIEVSDVARFKALQGGLKLGPTTYRGPAFEAASA